MTEVSYKRWYDEDPIVKKCVSYLENMSDNLKRKTATYLMDEIIDKPPFSDMVPDDVFDIATAEENKRRWYDFDEVVRIFFELLKSAPKEVKTQIAMIAITFIEDLILDKNKKIEISIPENDKYLKVSDQQTPENN